MSRNTALTPPSQGKTQRKCSSISQAPSVMRIWEDKEVKCDYGNLKTFSDLNWTLKYAKISLSRPWFWGEGMLSKSLAAALVRGTVLWDDWRLGGTRDGTEREAGEVCRRDHVVEAFEGRAELGFVLTRAPWLICVPQMRVGMRLYRGG